MNMNFPLAKKEQNNGFWLMNVFVRSLLIGEVKLAVNTRILITAVRCATSSHSMQVVTRSKFSDKNWSLVLFWFHMKGVVFFVLIYFLMTSFVLTSF